MAYNPFVLQGTTCGALTRIPQHWRLAFAGYRRKMSYREACCSLFSLHNETMNVWTHLLGALLFAWHLASLCVALSASAGGGQTVLALASNSAPHHDYGPPPLFLQGGVHSGPLLRAMAAPPTSRLCREGGPPAPPTPHAPPDTPLHVAVHWMDSASKAVAHAEAELLLRVAASGAKAASKLKQETAHVAESASLLNATQKHVVAFKEHMLALRTKVQSSAALSRAQLSEARAHLAAALSELRVEVQDGAHGAQEHMANTVAAVAQQWNALVHRVGVGHLSFDVDAQSVRHPHAFAMIVIATCAATTMGLSAVFHLLFVVGRPEASVLQRLDYAGIVILIAGSTYASVYFFFYCRPVAFWVYVLAATATNAYVGIMAQTEVFGSTAYDLLRPAAFTVAGVLCGVPIIHALLLPELQHLDAFWSMLQHILLQGALYLVGVSMYAAKFPERFAPGWCDVFMGSHQLFHVCVAAAAWMLYTGAQHMEHFLEDHPNFCMALEQ